MKSRRLFLGYEVSDAANRVDLHLGAALGQLFAQAMDIDLDCIRGDIAGQTENMVLDQFFRDNAILAPHQEFEHGSLAGCAELWLVVDERLVALSIEWKVWNLHGTCEQLAGTP